MAVTNCTDNNGVVFPFLERAHSQGYTDETLSTKNVYIAKGDVVHKDTPGALRFNMLYVARTLNLLATQEFKTTQAFAKWILYAEATVIATALSGVVEVLSSATVSLEPSTPSTPSTLSTPSTPGTEFSVDADVVAQRVAEVAYSPLPQRSHSAPPTISTSVGIADPEYIGSPVTSPAVPEIDPSLEVWTPVEIEAFSRWFQKAFEVSTNSGEALTVDPAGADRAVLDMISQMQKLPEPVVALMRQFLSLPPESEEAQALVRAFSTFTKSPEGQEALSKASTVMSTTTSSAGSATVSTSSGQDSVVSSESSVDFEGLEAMGLGAVPIFMFLQYFLAYLMSLYRGEEQA